MILVRQILFLMRWEEGLVAGKAATAEFEKISHGKTPKTTCLCVPGEEVGNELGRTGIRANPEPGFSALQASALPGMLGADRGGKGQRGLGICGGQPGAVTVCPQEVSMRRIPVRR